VALELVHERLQGLERQSQAALQAGTAELVREGEGAQQKAGHEVATNTKMIQLSGGGQGTGLHGAGNYSGCAFEFSRA
jgi:hypothetical protein